MPRLSGFVNLGPVIAQLKKRRNIYQPNDRSSVLVGYTAAYAIFVHENLQAFHKNGQAKFLEQPAREKAHEIRQIIKNSVASGLDLPNSLYKGGAFLQGESQELCPVKTGNLKGSAFTRMEQ
jgi:hypothetical protein